MTLKEVKVYSTYMLGDSYGDINIYTHVDMYKYVQIYTSPTCTPYFQHFFLLHTQNLIQSIPQSPKITQIKKIS